MMKTSWTRSILGSSFRYQNSAGRPRTTNSTAKKITMGAGLATMASTSRVIPE